MIGEQGDAVKNVSVAVQAEKPRLAKYIDDIKTALACVLRVDQTAIGVSAGTNEGLGYVGEGNGKVSIYKGKEPLLRHVPETEAIEKLLELIENESDCN